MADNQAYIYNIEFTIENIEIFDNQKELEYLNDLDFLVRFQMNPLLCLEVTEEEHLHSINCGGKAVKNIMFVMNASQLNYDPKACITAYKIQCPSDVVAIGCYNIPKLHCKFQELKKKFDCTGQSSSEVIKELAVLENCDKKGTGSIHYILCLTCYGSSVGCDMNMNKKYGSFNMDVDSYGRIKGCTARTEKATEDCIQTCPKEDQSQYDEYMAQVNGNSLIVRVTKDHFVTRVYDSTCDSSKDRLTIRGCDQQIDFKFPNNFTCCQCKKKFGSCKCSGDSNLTDFQKRASCSGSSYKNSRALPVIRGNLKYPGRFEDQSMNFDVQDQCTPQEVSEKYKIKPQSTRAICLQADDSEFEGSKIPNGIEVCRIGCEDDVDVFVWKISQKRTSKNGKKNEMELEMRTPRGPKVDIPKKETREVQVIEEEFEECKKGAKKEVTTPKTGVAPKSGIPPKNGAATKANSKNSTSKKVDEKSKKSQSPKSCALPKACALPKKKACK